MASLICLPQIPHSATTKQEIIDDGGSVITVAPFLITAGLLMLCYPALSHTCNNACNWNAFQHSGRKKNSWATPEHAAAEIYEFLTKSL